MSITTPGLCRLSTGPSGEDIDIKFDATYWPATGGSSAWSMTATNVRLFITQLKFQGPRYYLLRFRGMIADPFVFVEQYVIIQRITDAGYEGELSLPLYIRGGEDGMTKSYLHFVEIDRMSDDLAPDPDALDRNVLIDTGAFEVDMFDATPFADTAMGNWGSL
jgi:hypothetical protein